MMRETGPIRKNNIGGTDVDTDLAAPYIGQARTLLGIVKNQLRLGKLQQLSRTFYLPDGTTIYVSSVFGQDRVDITPAAATSTSEETSEVFEQPMFPVDIYTPPNQFQMVIASGSVLGELESLFDSEMRPILINGNLISAPRNTLYSIDPSKGGTVLERTAFSTGSPNAVLIGLADPTGESVLPLAQQPTSFTLIGKNGALDPTTINPSVTTASVIIEPPVITGTKPANMGLLTIPFTIANDPLRILSDGPLGKIQGLINLPKTLTPYTNITLNFVPGPKVNSEGGVSLNATSAGGMGGFVQANVDGVLVPTMFPAGANNDDITTSWVQNGGNYFPTFTDGGAGAWSLVGNIPNLANTTNNTFGVITFEDVLGGTYSIGVSATWVLT